jgi:hypothetical protein
VTSEWDLELGTLDTAEEMVSLNDVKDDSELG